MKKSVEVEPLTEARWDKIEQAVFAELDASPAVAEKPSVSNLRGRTLGRRVALVAAVFAVAASVGFGIHVTRNVQPKSEIALGAPASPMRIVTGDMPSQAPIGTTELEVGPASAVVASGDDSRGILVVLERGRVTCSVAPRKERPPFVVQASDVRVTVIGTKFQVERDDAQHDVRVRVEHGRVEVNYDGQSHILSDGQFWSSSANREKTELSEAGTVLHVDPPVVLPGAAKPSTHEVTGDKQSYDLAARNEAKDPALAMKTYQRLAHSGGAWSAPALFAAGRLAADRGSKKEAEALLHDYLRKYPAGANAEDARRLLSRLE